MNQMERKPLKNGNLPATSKQRWFLFLLTKEDYREKDISMQEASDLIDKLKKEKEAQKARKITVEIEGDSPSIDEIMTLVIEQLDIKGIEYTV